MKTFTASITLIAALALMTGIFVTQATAEGPTRATPPMQQPNQVQKLTNLNQMMDKMQSLVDRLHHIHQTVEARLQSDQSPENMADLSRFKEFESSMGNLGEQIKATIQNYNLLVKDKEKIKSFMNSGDLTALHEDLSNLTLLLEKSVNTLEAINERLANTGKK